MIMLAYHERGTNFPPGEVLSNLACYLYCIHIQIHALSTAKQLKTIQPSSDELNPGPLGPESTTPLLRPSAPCVSMQFLDAGRDHFRLQVEQVNVQETGDDTLTLACSTDYVVH